MDGGVPKCPGCGYPAVTAGRTICPECGLSYDPTHPKRRRIVEWLLWTGASALVTTIGYSIIALMVIRGVDELLILQIFGAVLVSVFQAIVLCATVLRRELFAERFIVVLTTHIGLMLLLVPVVQAMVFVFAIAAWTMGW